MVVTTGPRGAIEADGAFDLVGIGGGTASGWPVPEMVRWVQTPDPESIWILDYPSEDALALFDAFAGDATAAFSVAPVRQAVDSQLRQLPLVPVDDIPEALGMHVPVNPLARTYRHTGLGFTGYILVLTDRSGTPPVEPPTAGVAWLTSRFYDEYVVVVEGGKAAVWKGRALRGVIGVDTRTDLWRLVAHGAMTVDLTPGEIISRECIESLRFGTPIVVPSDTVGAAHALAGGGLIFTCAAELLEAIRRLLDVSERQRVSDLGVAYAESLYGDPTGFVARIARELGRPLS
jgi:hypothetical protein